ncbi:MAG: ABC transporter ATP-binding protein [Solobacterium sp.]|nr:ABC transporter ATP-binding protein [Solobacterium sp.]
MKFEVKNASFSFGSEQVFRNVSMTAEKGRIVSVLGPNGAGKTTLLRCMLGFLKPDQGEILIDGKPKAQISNTEFWKKTAYVPQARMQSFPYSVEETVLMGRSPYLSIFRMPSENDRKIAEKAMEMAGILHLRNKNCARISGGELQLTLIARALAQQPEMLVMDEPETGLDFRNQLIVIGLIEKLCREDGLSIIFNTHYPEHAFGISHDTLLLKADGTALFGNTSEILTPENMRDAFGVEIRMVSQTVDGRNVSSIIPVGLVQKEN